MRKVKLGEVTTDEIDDLKKVMTKLKQMTWLEDVIGSEGIQEMLDETNNTLSK